MAQAHTPGTGPLNAAQKDGARRMAAQAPDPTVQQYNDAVRPEMGKVQGNWFARQTKRVGNWMAGNSGAASQIAVSAIEGGVEGMAHSSKVDSGLHMKFAQHMDRVIAEEASWGVKYTALSEQFIATILTGEVYSGPDAGIKVEGDRLEATGSALIESNGQRIKIATAQEGIKENTVNTQMSGRRENLAKKLFAEHLRVLDGMGVELGNEERVLLERTRPIKKLDAFERDILFAAMVGRHGVWRGAWNGTFSRRDESITGIMDPQDAFMCYLDQWSERVNTGETWAKNVASVLHNLSKAVPSFSSKGPQHPGKFIMDQRCAEDFIEGRMAEELKLAKMRVSQMATEILTTPAGSMHSDWKDGCGWFREKNGFGPGGMELLEVPGLLNDGDVPMYESPGVLEEKGVPLYERARQVEDRLGILERRVAHIEGDEAFASLESARAALNSVEDVLGNRGMDEQAVAHATGPLRAKIEKMEAVSGEINAALKRKGELEEKLEDLRDDIENGAVEDNSASRMGIAHLEAGIAAAGGELALLGKKMNAVGMGGILHTRRHLLASVEAELAAEEKRGRDGGEENRKLTASLQRRTEKLRAEVKKYEEKLPGLKEDFKKLAFHSQRLTMAIEGRRAVAGRTVAALETLLTNITTPVPEHLESSKAGEKLFTVEKNADLAGILGDMEKFLKFREALEQGGAPERKAPVKTTVEDGKDGKVVKQEFDGEHADGKMTELFKYDREALSRKEAALRGRIDDSGLAPVVKKQLTLLADVIAYQEDPDARVPLENARKNFERKKKDLEEAVYPMRAVVKAVGATISDKAMVRAIFDGGVEAKEQDEGFLKRASAVLMAILNNVGKVGDWHSWKWLGGVVLKGAAYFPSMLEDTVVKDARLQKPLTPPAEDASAREYATYAARKVWRGVKTATYILTWPFGSPLVKMWRDSDAKENRSARQKAIRWAGRIPRLAITGPAGLWWLEVARKTRYNGYMVEPENEADISHMRGIRKFMRKHVWPERPSLRKGYWGAAWLTGMWLGVMGVSGTAITSAVSAIRGPRPAVEFERPMPGEERRSGAWGDFWRAPAHRETTMLGEESTVWNSDSFFHDVAATAWSGAGDDEIPGLWCPGVDWIPGARWIWTPYPGSDMSRRDYFDKLRSPQGEGEEIGGILRFSPRSGSISKLPRPEAYAQLRSLFRGVGTLQVQESDLEDSGHGAMLEELFGYANDELMGNPHADVELLEAVARQEYRRQSKSMGRADGAEPQIGVDELEGKIQRALTAASWDLEFLYRHPQVVENMLERRTGTRAIYSEGEERGSGNDEEENR